jgi:hypothetical protein
MKLHTTQIAKKLFGILTIASCLTIFETTVLSQVETAQKGEPRMPASLAKTCVMYFERPENPYWTQLQKKFQNHPEMIMIATRNPSDMVRCVMTHNPEEVLILGPLMQTPYSKKLAISVPVSDVQAAKNYNHALVAVKKQHAKILLKRSFAVCKPGRSTIYPCNNEQKKELALRAEISRLSKLKTTDAAYKFAYGYKKIALKGKAFEDLSTLAKTSNLNLRRIKTMSRNPRAIIASYSGLKSLSHDQSIRVKAVSTAFWQKSNMKRRTAMVDFEDAL